MLNSYFCRSQKCDWPTIAQCNGTTASRTPSSSPTPSSSGTSVRQPLVIKVVEREETNFRPLPNPADYWPSFIFWHRILLQTKIFWLYFFYLWGRYYLWSRYYLWGRYYLSAVWRHSTAIKWRHKYSRGREWPRPHQYSGTAETRDLLLVTDQLW